MTTTKTVNAIAIAQEFARAAQQPLAREVWVRQRDAAVDLWLITAPLDADAELDLYELEDIVLDRFPGVAITVHLINPTLYDPFDLRLILPADAVQVTPPTR